MSSPSFFEFWWKIRLFASRSQYESLPVDPAGCPLASKTYPLLEVSVPNAMVAFRFQSISPFERPSFQGSLASLVRSFSPTTASLAPCLCGRRPTTPGICPCLGSVYSAFRGALRLDADPHAASSVLQKCSLSLLPWGLSAAPLRISTLLELPPSFLNMHPTWPSSLLDGRLTWWLPTASS
jgi:hypothetical protein